VYAALPRGRSAGRSREVNNELGARLRRLEQLVSNVVSPSPANQQSGPTLSVPQQSLRQGSFGEESVNDSSDALESLYSSGSESSRIKPGRVVLDSSEIIYVSGDHWTSVCNEV